jgi:hypothetical protein
MIFHHLLFSLLIGSQVTEGYHHHSLRAVPATRRRLIPKWPYAFLVSHVGFDSGKDWCITAKHGVTDGSDVGFDLCDFDQAPPSQLFMLDDVGKIHTKVDEKQCLAVDQGSRTDLGGARIKFFACDEPTATFNTFEHNRNTTVLRVHDDRDCCIKQTGNDAQTTDTLRTEICEEDNPCFIYDYVEQNCEIGGFLNNDVKCCKDTDCTTNVELCQNYTCVCSTDIPGVDCCQDSDCPQDYACTSSYVREFGYKGASSCNAECCEDQDCPTGFTCEDNTCLTPATFLVSTINNQSYCISANRGVDEGVEVGSELCDFTNKPSKQLWHQDVHNKFHSDLNLDRCMVVGGGPNVDTGFIIQMTQCKVDMFVHNSETNHIHLEQDPAYCLTSMQEEYGMVCGKPCVAGDETFTIAMKPV